MTIDISNMYLNTHLDRYEYMKFHLKDLPQEVIDEYDLLAKADEKGWCYCEIRKAIYGLKQSGFLAHQQLENTLRAEDYTHHNTQLACGCTRQRI